MEDYDAGGDTAVVESSKVITIRQGKKLINANVSTVGEGKVEYINEKSATVTLTGDMSFGNDGEIDALSGKMVTIISESADGQTYDIGYINKATVTADKTQYIVTLTSIDESGLAKSKTVPFDFKFP